MTLIMMKKLSLKELKTLSLLSKYFKNSMWIAHYFNNLQKFVLMIFNEFQKFKSNALHFVIQSWHLFKQINKNVLLCCEGVGFEGGFGKQQVIDEGTATRSMRPASTVRVCISLNK